MTRNVWYVLITWGVAIMLLVGILSGWIAHNQRQQDLDMCTLIGALRGGPDPVAGPAGERGRAVQEAMASWYERRDCPVG